MIQTHLKVIGCEITPLFTKFTNQIIREFVLSFFYVEAVTNDSVYNEQQKHWEHILTLIDYLKQGLSRINSTESWGYQYSMFYKLCTFITGPI